MKFIHYKTDKWLSQSHWHIFTLRQTRWNQYIDNQIYSWKTSLTTLQWQNSVLKKYYSQFYMGNFGWRWTKSNFKLWQTRPAVGWPTSIVSIVLEMCHIPNHFYIIKVTVSNIDRMKTWKTLLIMTYQNEQFADKEWCQTSFIISISMMKEYYWWQ